MRATSAKFGVHAGSMTFNTQSEGGISTPIIICIIVPVLFYIHRVRKI